jgi:hypothetical protein
MEKGGPAGGFADAKRTLAAAAGVTRAVVVRETLVVAAPEVDRSVAYPLLDDEAPTVGTLSAIGIDSAVVARVRSRISRACVARRTVRRACIGRRSV